MPLSRIVIFILTSLTFGITSPAQQPSPTSAPQNQSPPQRDAQALQILTSALASMGDGRQSGKIDWKIEGTLSNPDNPDVSAGTFIAKARGYDFSLDSTEGSNTTSFRILRNIGSTRTNGTTKHLPLHSTTGFAPDLLPSFHRWIEFANTDVSVRLLPNTDMDGKPCYLIEVEAPKDQDKRKQNDLAKTDLLVDQSTGLIAAIRTSTSPTIFPSVRVTVETRYSDYQNVAGILVPMTVQKFSNGQLARVLHITSVTFNNGLTNSDFRNAE